MSDRKIVLDLVASFSCRAIIDSMPHLSGSLHFTYDVRKLPRLKITYLTLSNHADFNLVLDTCRCVLKVNLIIVK